MSSRHTNSRRQAYGRRMKDLRTRRTADLEIDLDGPSDWSRGGDWDSDRPLTGFPLGSDRSGPSVRAR